MLKNNNYLESIIADYVRLKVVELKSAVLDKPTSDIYQVYIVST